MSTRQVVESFWAAMIDNDWTRAAERLAPGCVIDWPCSRERFVGRADFAAVQAAYPTGTGRWSFDVRHLVCEGDTAISHVFVTDGAQPATVISIATVEGELVTNLVEYWPNEYEPAAWREPYTAP